MTIQESKQVQRTFDGSVEYLLALDSHRYLPAIKCLRGTLADAMMVECLRSELADCEQSTPLAATPL